MWKRGARVGCIPLILAVACGIPSYPYLAPPPLETVEYPTSPEAGLKFEYGIPVSNNATIFEGFDLYYKLYSAIDREENLIESDRLSSINQRRLEENLFRRLYEPSSAPEDQPIRPLIELSDAQKSDGDLRVILDFSYLNEQIYVKAFFGETDSPDLTEITDLARDVSVPEDSAEGSLAPVYKGFTAAEFLPGDGDLPVTYDPENDATATLYVALYVLSYGNDYQTSLNFNLYSEPLYLGFIAIPFFAS